MTTMQEIFKKSSIELAVIFFNNNNALILLLCIKKQNNKTDLKNFKNNRWTCENKQNVKNKYTKGNTVLINKELYALYFFSIT